MLEQLITALNDCIWAFDLDQQTYLFISPCINVITGYKAHDFEKDHNLWNEIIDPQDLDKVKAADKDVNYNNWTELIYRITLLSNKTKWINQKKRLIKDEPTGNTIVLSVINEVNNIAHGKTTQEEITWTKNNLEALINNTEDFIWSIDKDGRYVYMNSGYKKRILSTTGIIAQEGDDAYRHSGSTDEINEKWRSYYQRAFLGERYVIRHESFELDSTGSSYFEVSFNPIYRESKDEVIGVGCFARDITERLKTEKALIEQNERLKNIASLSSHELRRPVASMLGLINIIDRKNFSNPNNEQVIEYLLTVSKEIDEVIRLIVNKTFIDLPDQTD